MKTEIRPCQQFLYEIDFFEIPFSNLRTISSKLFLNCLRHYRGRPTQDVNRDKNVIKQMPTNLHCPEHGVQILIFSKVLDIV